MSIHFANLNLKLVRTIARTADKINPHTVVQLASNNEFTNALRHKGLVNTFFNTDKFERSNSEKSKSGHII